MSEPDKSPEDAPRHLFSLADAFGALSSNPVLDVCGLQNMRRRGEDAEMLILAANRCDGVMIDRGAFHRTTWTYQQKRYTVNADTQVAAVTFDPLLTVTFDDYGLPLLDNDQRERLMEIAGFNEGKAPMPGA